MTEERTSDQRLAEMLEAHTYDERMGFAQYLFDSQDALEEDPKPSDFAYWLGEWARRELAEV